MIFGVEALEKSQKFPETHFADVDSGQEAIGKETALDGFGPLADLLDQYASVCNEILSLFAHTILRLFEAINNIGSPVELFTSFCVFSLTLFFSVCRFLVYEAISLVTLPFRIFLNLLFSHPVILTAVALLCIITCTAFVVIIKQISIFKLCNATIRLIAPYCYRFAHTLFMYLCPQYCFLVSVLHLFMAPVRYFWDLFGTILLLVPVFGTPSLRPIPSTECITDDVSRITCCICYIHEKSVLLQPCNHICVCAVCVEELLESCEEPLCPLCRTVISSYIDVYI